MLELNRQLRDFYKAYRHKPLRPETALELSSDFVLDLINVFGEQLSEAMPLKPDWQNFAPFEFLLSLNETLGRYKETGYDALSDDERKMMHDHDALLGSLIKAALTNHPDSFPDEEHFQSPHAVARELLVLSEFS